jgi:AcrR family transcriptional regulator
MNHPDFQKIYQTSLHLLNANGFENTTMDQLAQASQLKTSEFQKHFSTKESIIQTFYIQNCSELELKAQTFIKESNSFEERFKKLLQFRLSSLKPHRDSVVNVSMLAINPKSPLSAFGNSSADLRNQCIQMIEQLIEGSDFCCHPELKKFVPTLLWFYMGAILFYWVHDESEDTQQSVKLVDSLTPLILKIISTSRFSFAASAVKPVIKLLNDFIKVK